MTAEYRDGELASSLLAGNNAKLDTELDGLFKIAPAKPQEPAPMLAFDVAPPKNEKQATGKPAKSVEAGKKDKGSLKRPRASDEGEDAAEPAGKSKKVTRGAGGEDTEGTPKTTKPEAKPDDPEKTERTVFIGNLTTEAITNKSVYKAVKKMFSKYGEIESIRFRSVAFSKLLSRKAAFISKQIHKDRSTCNAYIVFKDKETAQKACELNGTVLHEKHIRVDLASSSGKSDPKRTVFIGSVAFDEEEENVWNHFSTCGIVENVRLVRDPKTNLGKGFGYVQFRDVASVGLALKLDQTKLGERKIRVSRCTRTTKKSAPEGGAAKKKRRTNKDEPVAVEGARAAKGDRIGKTKKLRNGEAAKKRLARKTKKQKQK